MSCGLAHVAVSCHVDVIGVFMVYWCSLILRRRLLTLLPLLTLPHCLSVSLNLSLRLSLSLNLWAIAGGATLPESELESEPALGNGPSPWPGHVRPQRFCGACIPALSFSLAPARGGKQRKTVIL